MNHFSLIFSYFNNRLCVIFTVLISILFSIFIGVTASGGMLASHKTQFLSCLFCVFSHHILTRKILYQSLPWSSPWYAPFLPHSHAPAPLATFPRSSSLHGLRCRDHESHCLCLWESFLFHYYFLFSPFTFPYRSINSPYNVTFNYSFLISQYVTLSTFPSRMLPVY